MLDDLREARHDSWDDYPDNRTILDGPDPTENIDDDKVLPWPPK